jgi:hypothetical protein
MGHDRAPHFPCLRSPITASHTLILSTFSSLLSALQSMHHITNKHYSPFFIFLNSSLFRFLLKNCHFSPNHPANLVQIYRKFLEIHLIPCYRISYFMISFSYFIAPFILFSGFEEIIRTHFKLKKKSILEQITKWTAEASSSKKPEFNRLYRLLSVHLHQLD